MPELWRLSAADAADGIRRSEFKSEQLVEACLERIAGTEPKVRAFVDLQAKQALDQARRLDTAGPHPDLPLYGVPVAIKEILDVQGVHCCWGSPIHKDRIPASDAAAVEKLKAAGAIILGTVVSTEYAIAAAGPTTNPHDPERTPGGSSSGPAAAVASFMVPLAIGSQSIGSIVRPSLYCGVLGLKPTKGAISNFGGMTLATELDHVGPIARTPEDLALACRILFDHDPRDPASLSVDPPPLSGWQQAQKAIQVNGPLRDRVHEPSRVALERALTSLKAAGLPLETLELPAEFDRIQWCTETILCRGMALHHGIDRDQRGALMSERVRYLVDCGRGISNAEHNEALALARHYSDFLKPHLGNATVMVSAATEGVAPLRSEGTGSPFLQALWTLIGWPVLGLPCGSHGHLPIGVQLAAAPGGEQLLLAAARSVMNQQQEHPISEVPPKFRLPRDRV